MFDKVMEVGKVVYLIKLVLLPYNFEVNECIFQQYYLFEEATNQWSPRCRTSSSSRADNLHKEQY